MMILTAEELQELADLVVVMNDNVGAGGQVTFGGQGFAVYDAEDSLIGHICYDEDNQWHLEYDE